jgi:uncharacterized membrane protein
MRRGVVIIGIIICVVGAFVGILCAFVYPETIRPYVGSEIVDFLGIFSVLGFVSFFVGMLLSIIGAILKKKKPKKTKIIPYSRYYDP